MAEFTPVIDVTEEFFSLDRYEFNDFIRGLGKEALVGVSYSLPSENTAQENQALLRQTKAFVEKSPNRNAAVIATEEQVSIEPNVFYSGVIRVSPDQEN
jgi:hypothetical protein